MATPNQPMRTGSVTPQMRQQLAPFFRIAQSSVPGNVSNPGPVPVALLVQIQRQGIPFLGEPQFSNSNQGRDNFIPGAQGNSAGAPAIPLSAVHMIPQR